MKLCVACGNDMVPDGSLECPKCGGATASAKRAYRPRQRPSGLFVSYSRRDAFKAEVLASELSLSGLRVWRDVERIWAGEGFPGQIYRELENCLRVVVLWSSASVKSEWVLREAEFGLTHQKILPIKLDDVSPPSPFDTVQCIDLTCWDGSPAHSSLRRVRAEVARVVSLAGG